MRGGQKSANKKSHFHGGGGKQSDIGKIFRSLRDILRLKRSVGTGAIDWYHTNQSRVTENLIIDFLLIVRDTV